MGVVLNVTVLNIRAAVGATAETSACVPDRHRRPAIPTDVEPQPQPGQVKANLVIVPVGNAARCKVRLYNLSRATDLAVDVVGYMRANQNPVRRRRRAG